MKYWIETHHLKCIFLSFRNIIKFLTWINCYGVERPTFRLIRESFGCHNLNSVDRKSKMLWFSECLETDLLNGTGGLGLGSREWTECASKSLRLPRVG